MPLMNSQGNANVFKQSSAPSSPATGDVWIDTDNGVVSTYSGSAWVQQTGGALGSASTALQVNAGGTALEYAAAGAWKLAGQASLSGGAADIITVSSLPTYDVYHVIAIIQCTNDVAPVLRCNGDAGGNYNYDLVRNDTLVQSTGANGAVMFGVALTNIYLFLEYKISNFAAGVRKEIIGEAHAGALLSTFGGAWINTVDLITSLSIANIDTGDMGTNTQMVVLGRNIV